MSAEEINVLVSKGRNSGDIGDSDIPTFLAELVDHSQHVETVPAGNWVESEAECAELFFLPLKIGFSGFAAVSMT